MLRERGLRLTPQRQLILEAVHELGHATPEQIHHTVRERAAGVNITTVYRTLELLEDLSLVSHTHLSHGSPTYHRAGEDQHVHLVCRNCGSIEDTICFRLSAAATKSNPSSVAEIPAAVVQNPRQASKASDIVR